MANLGFIGVADLSRGLRDRANMDDVKNVVKLNGSEMQRNMQRDAPVDTGFLKRSVTLNATDGGLGVKVGPTAHYAPYLVYGTRFNYMQDFFRPNFFKQRQKFISDMNRLMR